MSAACDECYGIGCEACNFLGWYREEPKKMSAVKIEVKKFGQITQVIVDGKVAYSSGNTVKSEVKNLKALIEKMVIENVEVVEG